MCCYHFTTLNLSCYTCWSEDLRNKLDQSLYFQVFISLLATICYIPFRIYVMSYLFLLLCWFYHSMLISSLCFFILSFLSSSNFVLVYLLLQPQLLVLWCWDNKQQSYFMCTFCFILLMITILHHPSLLGISEQRWNLQLL